MESYALVLDWDQTLSPVYMQEPLLKHMGNEPSEYWKQVKEYDKKYAHGESFLRVFLEEPEYQGMTRKDLEEAAQKVPYFEGVNDFFRDLKTYAKEKDIDLKIYIASTGHKEMVEASELGKYFDGVYGAEFTYKGDKPVDVASVLPPEAKPGALKDISVKEGIPLDNFIYFGDGFSDLPAFHLVNEHGGASVCVGGKEEYGRQATYWEKPDYTKLTGLVKEIIESDASSRKTAEPPQSLPVGYFMM